MLASSVEGTCAQEMSCPCDIPCMQFEAHSAGAGGAPGGTQEETAAQARRIPNKEVANALP